MSANQALTVASLQRAVQQASQTGNWIVIVYPTAELAEQGRNIIPAMLPEGSTGGGRTTLLPSGGRVSVVTGSETPFQTEESLTVMFLEWGGATDKKFDGMAAWRAASSTVIGAEGGRAA